jgi:hypothetical protein
MLLPLWILTIGCSAAVGGTSSVCGCVRLHSSAEEAYNEAIAVFLGQVIEQNRVMVHLNLGPPLDRVPGEQLRIVVHEAWKGVAAGDTVVVTGWSNCFAFDPGRAHLDYVGQLYLVYADIIKLPDMPLIEGGIYLTPTRPDTLVSSSACTRTRDVTTAAVDLLWLREHRAGGP